MSAQSRGPTPRELDALSAALARGQRDGAVRLARALTERYPSDARAWQALAVVQRQMGRGPDALAAMQKAVSLAPGDGELHLGLAVLLNEHGRLADAEAAYRRALELRPDSADGHVNLGVLCWTSGRLSEAEACYRRALELKPEWAEAHSNLGNALKGQGRLAEAEASLRRAVRLRPDLPDALSNLLLTLNYLPEWRAADIFAEHLEFERRFCARFALPPHDNAPDPARRLRVGYVSGDFCDHPVAYFIEPVLAHHDAAHFEVFCYHNLRLGDAVTARLKSRVSGWREVATLDDDALAAQVRADRIDVLVDLSGHTARNRLLTFARRPAPVQATWLGYPNTTGMRAIGYRISDRHATPPDLERRHSEALIRLPHSQWCYRPPAQYPEAAARPSGSLLRFAVFAPPAKINERAIELWSRLLKREPRARLTMVMTGAATAPGHFAKWFARHRIGADRVQLMGARPLQEYLALHASVDAVLDTFPYGGVTTTCHALWMGVPVVTLAGDTASSGGAASLLHAAGLQELVAADGEQYVDRALRAAADAVRGPRLRERVCASPLMDAARFTRDLEAAYREMWRAWRGR